MSTETMERPVAAAPVAALAPPQRAAVALNTAEYEIKLRELLTNSVGILSVTNKAGRDECHSAYMVLKNTRCGITNLAEDATEDAKAFTKAVKTEAARLIAITTAEEDRLQSLRDGWDAAEQARKDALIAAERARVEAIQADIDRLRAIPSRLIGKSSDDLAFARKDMLAMDVAEARFAEFTETARTIVADVIARIELMWTAELEREAVALAAEEARIAEAARLEAERKELAELRAAAERTANEQAAERQRLADLAAAQALAAKQLADKAAANLKAEQDALAERERIANEAQAKAAAELKAAQDKHAAEVAAHAAAVQREADHPEALEMNAEFDAAKDAQREQDHLDSLAQDDAAADLARCEATAQAMLTNGRSLALPESYSDTDALIDAGFTEVPTDCELVDLYIENFGGEREQAIERLARFDAVAARQMAAP